MIKKHRCALLLPVLGLSVAVLLSGCATTQPQATAPFTFNEGLSSQLGGDSLLYVPAQHYCTWVNQYINSNNQPIGQHYHCWVGQQGHWQVQVHATPGMGARLLGPVPAQE